MTLVSFTPDEEIDVNLEEKYPTGEYPLIPV
jgi:hypothetical protein